MRASASLFVVATLASFGCHDGRGSPGGEGPGGPGGPQGLQGAQGMPGPQGVPGLQGAAGQQGPAGQDGAQGPAGHDGVQGLQGNQGRDGAPGQQGERGPAGPEGAQGPEGLRGAGIATGAIVAFGGVSAPDGWLLCDGSAVSRTTYAPLFAVIGTQWGVGDGATSFNVPDLRGRFLRGVNMGSGRDPDAASRGSDNGGNSGDAVGSVQGDAFRLHSHTYRTLDPDDSSGGASSGGPNPTIMSTWTTATEGGSETRPVNAHVYWIIKT